jgi:hypothetical protein
MRIFFQGFVAYFDGVLNAVAKSEMTGEVKLYGTEVQEGRREILFAQIFYSA